MRDVSLRPHPEPQRLERLLERLPDSRIGGDPATLVTGVTHDLRQVAPGDLYIARAGERTHGIDHVADAVRAGAAAILTDADSEQRATAAGAGAVVVVPDPRAAMGATAAWIYGDPAQDLLVL